MADIIGTRPQVDEYIGSRLVVGAYQGSRKYFDAYSDVTGNLPLYFNSRVNHSLSNYRLYGTSDGAGVETENEFDKNAKNTDNGYMANCYLAADGSVVETTGYAISEYMLVSPNTEYTIEVGSRYNNPSVCIYDETKTYIEGFAYGRNNPKTITTGATAKYIRISFFTQNASIIAVMKSSDRPDPYIYIPYGYKIPLTLTSGVTENLFDINEYISQHVDGKYKDADGNDVVSNNTSYSEYKIAVVPNQAYTLKGKMSNGTGYTRAYFYNANGEWLGRTSDYAVMSTSSKTFTFTTPSDCRFIQIQQGNWVLTSGSQIMLVKGSTAPSEYIPHRYTADYNLYIGDIKLGEEEYLNFAEQKVYKRTVQLLPPYEMDEGASQKGYYLTSAGIVSTSSTAYNYVTGYIRVLPSETYALKNFSGNSTALCYYDTDKVYISGETYGNRGSFTVTTPANCQYVRMTAQDRDPNTNVFVKGNEIPETYIPYFQPTDPPAPLPAITAYSSENVLGSTETVGEVTLTGRLAKTYRQVEYLESTGTQYIETNIVPTYDDAVETYLQFTAPRKYPAKQGVLGTIYDNRRYAIVLGLIEENPLPVCFYCGYPWQTPDTNIQITANVATLTQKQMYYLSTTKFQLGTESKTPPSVSQSPPQKTFLLFGMWDNDGVAYPFAGFETMRCFGLTFSVAGVITHNLIPVERSSDGALGMLDTITNKFYTNAGTGTFVKGGYV